MSLDNKVIWSEGMFLNPHHFQQQERYVERYIDGKCAAYGAYGWGIHHIEVDQELLKLGKISLINAKGVFLMEPLLVFLTKMTYPLYLKCLKIRMMKLFIW